MVIDPEGFDRSVALPPELKISHIREAVEHVEDRASELVDIYFEQANVFSGIVGIMGVQALHALSPYKKHKHPDVSQQRSQTFHYGEDWARCQNRLWSRKVQLAPGPCSLITTMADGTLFGATLWTVPGA
jgi:hypothetical protein